MPLLRFTTAIVLSLAQIPLGSSRQVSTRLDTLDATSSTGSTRRTCRVETWRAKWNLGYCENFATFTLFSAGPKNCGV